MSQSIDTVPSSFAQGWPESEKLEREARSLKDAATPATLPRTERETARLVQGILAPIDGGPCPRQIVFCAVQPFLDCSRVTVEVANALERMDAGSVCLVETDAEAKPLTRLLGVYATPLKMGDQAPLRERCTHVQGNLWVAMPEMFTFRGGTVLKSDQVKEVLGELRSAFDYVLVDAPPLDNSSSAILFAKASDATVVVLEASTKKHVARRAMEALLTGEVRLLGSVLTERTYPIPEPLYRRL